MRSYSVASLLALAALAACGSDGGTSNPGTPGDAGPGPGDAETPRDATPNPADAGTDAPHAVSPDAGPNAPPSSGVAAFYGLTSDDYAIYGTATKLEAFPLGGGPTLDVKTMGYDPASPRVYVTGPGLFILDNISALPNPPPPALAVWTKAHGLVQLSTSLDRNMAGFDSTSDDALARFIESINGVRTLTVERTDGTGKTALGPWPADAVWGALGPTGDVFVQTPQQITRYVQANAWAKSDLLPAGTTVSTWSFEPTGKLLAVDAATAGGKPTWELVDVASRSVTTPSPAADGAAVLFDAGGTQLFYTSGGAIERFTIATQKATELVPSGCTQLVTVSPDGSTLICTTATGLAAASATAPGALTPLAAPATAGATSLAFFTTDMTRVVFNVGKAGQAQTTVTAVPLNGGAANTLTTSSWANVVPLKGSDVALVDGPDRGNQLRVIDATGKNAARVIGSNIEVAFGVSADKSKAVYWSNGGLYVVPTY